MMRTDDVAAQAPKTHGPAPDLAPVDLCLRPSGGRHEQTAELAMRLE